MFIVEIENNEKHFVLIEQVVENDYKTITKKRYFFNWQKEKDGIVYKLMYKDDVLGLISLHHHVSSQAIEIKLLALSKENRGAQKKFGRIAGSLIAFSCREAIKKYSSDACVFLEPKTDLKQHYIHKYGMLDAGNRVFLEGQSLINLLIKYEV